MPAATTDFAAFSISDAKALLAVPEDASANRPYIEGDHLQSGDGWVGPGPIQTDANYSEFFALLERAFVSKNVIAEACERLTGAVIGWEPRWTWVPLRQDTGFVPVTPEEVTAITELETALTDWWDMRQVHKSLKRALFNMLWAERSCWRMYTPAGALGANGNAGAASLPEALAKIFLDIPEPEASIVVEDPDTKARLGIVVYTDKVNVEHVELSFLKPGAATGPGVFPQTVIKILPDGVNTNAANDFGGHLTIYMMSVDRTLVGGSERSLQRAYNTTLTLLQKGLSDNLFLERFFMNAMPPGTWEFETDGKTRKSFTPEKRVTGGKTDSYVQGVDYQEPDGKTVIKDPSVTIRQPLDPQGTISGCEYWYQTLLEAVRQDHVLINQLATPSGKSREHSRGDFIDSTKDPVMQMDLAGRELLLTVTCMAEAFLGSPGKWTSKFKPVFKCRPNYGPLSVSERAQNVAESAAGYLSDETVMALNGTDDVDAEQALIQAQPRKFLDLSARRSEVATKWAADFPREVALFLAGYTDAEIAEIMTRVAAAGATSVDPDAPGTNNPAPTPKPANAQ